MKTTIILAHPGHGSFNKAILNVVEKKLADPKRESILVDLNKEQFSPVLQESELRLFSKGQFLDGQVRKYQDILMDSNELVFIFLSGGAICRQF